MRFQLSELITRPEPSATPAITLALAFVTVAALSAAVGSILGAI
jgi:hypothetical protein